VNDDAEMTVNAATLSTPLRVVDLIKGESSNNLSKVEDKPLKVTSSFIQPKYLPEV
jgi:hypothetical protein